MWTFDALGYIAIGLATLFAVPVFSKQVLEVGKVVFPSQWSVIPLISFVYFYQNIFTTLLLLDLPWIVTALGSMLLLGSFLGEDRSCEAR